MVRYIPVLAAAIACATQGMAQAPFSPAAARLASVLGHIKREYVEPVDMMALADVAIDAIGKQPGIGSPRWSTCVASIRPGEGPPAFDRIAQALDCAGVGNKSPAAVDALVDAAIVAMLAHLDSNNEWFDAWTMGQVANDAANRRVRRARIGVTLKETATGTIVLRVEPGYPAALAGLTAGDRIVAIDGVPAATMSGDEIVARCLGDEGSRVVLTVQRGAGPPLPISIVRALMPLQPANIAFVRRGDVMVIVLDGLNPRVGEAMQKMVASQLPGLRAIVLDLRRNTGGLLSEAAGIADLFLDEGPIATLRGRSATTATTYRATPGQVAPGIPLVVISSPLTAVTVGVVVSALQDNGRAKVIGQPGIAAGALQSLITIDADHVLGLTTAHEYRASGKSLTEAPVVPDCPSDLVGDALLDAAVAMAAAGAKSCPGGL